MTQFSFTVSGGTISNFAGSITMNRNMMISLLLLPYFAVAFRGIASLSSALSTRSQPQQQQHHYTYHTTPTTTRLLMYLDEGSNEEGQPSPSTSSWSPAAADSSSNGSSTPATPLSEEELVRRILTGYDSTQAAALSSAEGKLHKNTLNLSNSNHISASHHL
jgi:hypothetical protein